MIALSLVNSTALAGSEFPTLQHADVVHTRAVSCVPPVSRSLGDARLLQAWRLALHLGLTGIKASQCPLRVDKDPITSHIALPAEQFPRRRDLGVDPVSQHGARGTALDPTSKLYRCKPDREPGACTACGGPV